MAIRNDNRELDDFKRIDLRQYLASVGYEEVRRKSSRNNTFMRCGADKVDVKLDMDGHWIYFSFTNPHSGTIIDFVQWHTGNRNIGEARKIIRRFKGYDGPLPLFRDAEPVPKDLARVQMEFGKMKIAPAHPYLVNERKVPASLLSSERFAGLVRVDERHNAVFPHFDDRGLCGFEKKNRGFNGFASGGDKGLWLSESKEGDRRLVVTESAVDALSHAALFLDENTCYASIGGNPDARQIELLTAQIMFLPSGAEVIAATDNDPDGRKLAELIRHAAISSGRHDVIFRVHTPEHVKDWNDVLRNDRAVPCSNDAGG